MLKFAHVAAPVVRYIVVGRELGGMMFLVQESRDQSFRKSCKHWLARYTVVERECSAMTLLVQESCEHF